MVNFHTNAEVVVLLFLYIYCLYYIIHIYSLSSILLAVSVIVMEVFREEKSVRRDRAGSKSVSDRLLTLWQD